MKIYNALPLEKYSSLHKISILSLVGIKKITLPPSLTMAFHFNLQTPSKLNPEAQLTFALRDSASLASGNPDFCIHNLLRWRLNVTQYDSFENYLQQTKRTHFRNYHKTQKTFVKYGATLSWIEHDWSEYVDAFYQLYLNVASKHGSQLYDLSFFRTIAKLSEYKLLCIWFNGVLISALVMIDEGSVFHSMVCGLDYDHSKKAHAYSIMHYEFIRFAIEAKKYTCVDIGITADKAKALLDFQPVSSCMDIYAKNSILKGLLRLISRFTTATINEQAKLELNFHWAQTQRQ